MSGYDEIGYQSLFNESLLNVPSGVFDTIDVNYLTVNTSLTMATGAVINGVFDGTTVGYSGSYVSVLSVPSSGVTGTITNDIETQSLKIWDDDLSNTLNIRVANLTADHIIYFPTISSDTDKIVTEKGFQTIYNKTLNTPSITTPIITAPAISSASSITATSNFSLNDTLSSYNLYLESSSNTALTQNRTITFNVQDANRTAATLDATESFTNKDITDHSNSVRATLIGNSSDSNDVVVTNSPTSGYVLTAISATGASWQANPTSLIGITDGASDYTTALGVGCLDSLTSGINNSALGYDAGTALTIGYDNVFMGASAAAASTASYENVIIGSGAVKSGTTTTETVAIGFQAGYAGSLGSSVLIGWKAGYAGPAGSCVAVGYNSLVASTSSTYTVAVGANTLNSATSGYNNVAVGDNVLQAITTQYEHTGVGYRALYNSTASSSCTAVGAYALYNSNVSINDAFGHSALYSNTTGSYNTGLGRQALYSLTTGTQNLGCGLNAGYYITSGNYNTYVGQQCYSPSGSNPTGNTCMGYNAGWRGGSDTQGNYNTCVGYYAGAQTTITGALAIGYGATCVLNNSIYTRTGLTVSASGATVLYITGNGYIGPYSSSKRFKEQIIKFDDDEQEKCKCKNILDLKPCTYAPVVGTGSRVDDKCEYKREIGFIAEEMMDIYPQCVVVDRYSPECDIGGPNEKEVCKEGKCPKCQPAPLSIRYDLLTVPIIECMKEMNTKLELVNKKNEALENEVSLLKKQIELIMMKINI